jgi:hypothetical protein
MTFEHLVSELILFLQPTAETFVRPPIPVWKQVALVIFRLVHAYSCKAINNLYGCGESTIRKYSLIVCRVFYCRDVLFERYIHAPRGHRLMDIIH